MEPPIRPCDSRLSPGHTRFGNPPASFRIEPFVPRRGIRGGDLQTIISTFARRASTLPASERTLVQVEPEVQVLCHCHWQADRTSAPAAVVVHGLEGSSDSQYVVGIANKLWDAGFSIIRMNVRNCGGTEKLSATLYHSGLSADIGEVIKFLSARDGLRDVFLAGFSMGGNQVLKLAGEWGTEAPKCLRGVAAVSPAMDLALSADALHSLRNRIYEWWFLLSLRASIRRKAMLFPEKFKVDLGWWRSIRDFDHTVTAPHCGFASAEDYYERSSASRVLRHIAVPTLILHAKDDPFIRVSPSSYEALAQNPCVHFVETNHGGHCGFLAAPEGYDGRWAERQAVRFFEHLLGR